MDSGVRVLATFGSDHSYIYSQSDYIGSGAFGIVYKGNVKKLLPFGSKKTVAIKVIHLSSEDATENWTAWEKRMKRLIDLKHANIATYHKIVLTELTGGPRVELIMEFYQDGDLASLLKSVEQNRSALALDSAVHYAQDIATGLKFLHENNLIHGDLTPQNILVKKLGQNENRLVIGDLDDVIQMQHSASCSRDITSFRGTIRYMSPEMLRKMVQDPEDIPGLKTDTWSLGCIMVELADSVLRHKRQWLRKGDKLIESGKHLTNHGYVMVVSNGYIPRVPYSAPPGLAVCAAACLRPAIQDRASANDVLSMMDAIRNSKRFLVFIHEDGFSDTCFELLEISSWQIRLIRLPEDCNLKDSPAVIETTAYGKPVYLFRTGVHEKDKEYYLDITRWNTRYGMWTTSFLRTGYGWRFEMMETGVPAQALCSIAVNSKIFFLVIFKTPERALRVFLAEADTATKSIKSLLSLRPELECSEHATTATRYGDKIYYLTLSGRGSWMGSFNTVTQEWISLPPLQMFRLHYASAVLQGDVYVLGGQDEAGQLAKCHRYNAKIRKWENVHDLTYPRMGHCAYVLHNRLYVYGGHDVRLFQVVRPMEVYDAERDDWWEVAIHRPLSGANNRSHLWRTICVDVNEDNEANLITMIP